MPATVSPDYVYLDYAATAPLCEEALEAMKPYLTCGRDNLALNMNANSLHSPGRAAFEALEAARKSIARDIGASRPSEVIFTSGSTESRRTRCCWGLLPPLPKRAVWPRARSRRTSSCRTSSTRRCSCLQSGSSSRAFA